MRKPIRLSSANSVVKYLRKDVIHVSVWRAECLITKNYKLTQFTDKFGSLLAKSYRNEKLLSAAGQIVSQCIQMCQLLHCTDEPKVAVLTC